MKPKRKTAKKIYFRGLSAKSDKSIYSRTFPTELDAIKDAIKRQKAGKIVQAEFWDATRPFSHQLTGVSLTTKKNVQIYNREKKRFEKLTSGRWRAF